MEGKLCKQKPFPGVNSRWKKNFDFITEEGPHWKNDGVLSGRLRGLLEHEFLQDILH